jgi:hypothetical protein
MRSGRPSAFRTLKIWNSINVVKAMVWRTSKGSGAFNEPAWQRRIEHGQRSGRHDDADERDAPHHMCRVITRSPRGRAVAA